MTVQTLTLPNVSRWCGHAAMDWSMQIELPHFDAIRGIPRRDDASATNGAAYARLHVLDFEGVGLTAIGCDDALTGVVGVGIGRGHGVPMWPPHRVHRADET